ncbi:sulfite reductase flavoprotein subunit alpha [Cellvibrio fibrivorans]|uniref:Sulfite reductase (NADPH) flavoprotein alpha-component n=1 Tax=Cellvibrio fibrivorans TaxID=126350 RepID=A0ABU1V0Q0_9GAMM|nr:sulfite reductase flavoprotein subunit alpha [Cellvibrio fibrivorans]MDR7091034.1 sulfite reductase (NADPH) flavoprotein alpha-component [Cellvibrio fibrivorans]
MRNVLFQIHWFLGITAGVVLAVVGLTGGLMSFERQIMDAISPSIVRVEVRGERLTPDAIAERFRAQRDGARVEQITLWPEADRSALIRVAPPPGERRGEAVYINPYSGELLGKINGEQFFRTVRSLHRWLLIPSEEGGINIGRQITGFSAFALVFFALSGLYLRWPRRALNWRNWFRIDFSLKGRNFYWALHSVIGTWMILMYLLMALTGLTWSYSWFKNGASIALTGEPVQERRGGPGGPGGPGGREGRGGMGNMQQEHSAPISVDLAWATFATEAANNFKFASISFPRSEKDPVMINYVTPDATNDRQRSSMTINAASGELISDQPYKPLEPLGKRIMQGIYELHTGEWFGTPGLIINMTASLLMPLFTITGFLLYFDRRKKKRKSKTAAAGISNAHTDADYWVVYASQTGTAEQLAWNTATILQSGGIKASVKNIAALDKSTLESAKKMLFLVSTFGEGEAPDSARGFARKLLKSSLGLSQLQFAVLGLGDKRYSDYCAFAEQVENWLQASGAKPLFARINVDNGNEQAINAWQKTIADISGVANVPAFAAPEYEEWRLQKRQLINEGSLGTGIYCVSLQPQKPGTAHWQAGDILEIKPQNNPALPHREYSIASLATDGRLDLVVRQTFAENGELGLGSGWLTATAEENGVVLARIRSNPSFHAPLTNCPMILIGAGTGIAGLRAHLHERYIKDVQQNWLIFGERQRSKDRLFASELDAWQQSGFLTELDEVYSRDGDGYVQNVLRSKQQQLCEWLDRGAAIYVCGGVAMGTGVHHALVEILGENDLQQLIETHRYRRDVY